MSSQVSPSSITEPTPINITTPAPPIDIDAWPDQDKDLVMTKFVLAGMKMSVNPDHIVQLPVVHWRAAFAAVHKGRRSKKNAAVKYKSVLFDTLKDGDTVIVQIRTVPGLYSSRTLTHWVVDLPAHPTYTSWQIFELVKGANFNQFVYNGRGSGCRTWTIALTAFLEQAGVLPSGTVQGALGHIAEFRKHALTENLYIPNERGATFYKLVQHSDGSTAAYEDEQYIPKDFQG